MNNTVMYKGYVGSVDFSADDQLLFGKVQGIRSLISYEGKSVGELIEDFQEAVDDYLRMCKEEGVDPETPYKGSLNIRLGRELHRDAAVCALAHNISLNSFIQAAVRERVNREQAVAGFTNSF